MGRGVHWIQKERCKLFFQLNNIFFCAAMQLKFWKKKALFLVYSYRKRKKRVHIPPFRTCSQCAGNFILRIVMSCGTMEWFNGFICVCMCVCEHTDTPMCLPSLSYIFKHDLFTMFIPLQQLIPFVSKLSQMWLGLPLTALVTNMFGISNRAVYVTALSVLPVLVS